MSELNIFLFVFLIILLIVRHQIFIYKNRITTLKKINIFGIKKIIQSLVNDMNNQIVFLKSTLNSYEIYVQKQQQEGKNYFKITLQINPDENIKLIIKELEKINYMAEENNEDGQFLIWDKLHIDNLYDVLQNLINTINDNKTDEIYFRKLLRSKLV